MDMKLFDILVLIMLELLRKLKLNNKFLKKKEKIDMTSVEKNLYKEFLHEKIHLLKELKSNEIN